MTEETAGAATQETAQASSSAQNEINEAEWKNPENWGGPPTLAVYFSKRDARVWVPQHKPSIGWTVNLAHTGGILWMIGICVGMILLLVVLTGWVFSEQITNVLL